MNRYRLSYPIKSNLDLFASALKRGGGRKEVERYKWKWDAHTVTYTAAQDPNRSLSHRSTGDTFEITLLPDRCELTREHKVFSVRCIIFAECSACWMSRVMKNRFYIFSEIESVNLSKIHHIYLILAIYTLYSHKYR